MRRPKNSHNARMMPLNTVLMTLVPLIVVTLLSSRLALLLRSLVCLFNGDELFLELREEVLSIRHEM
jgi:hypothetical protein